MKCVACPDLGTTFVFVTHDQSEALALPSRVAIFHHVIPQNEVYERDGNRFVAEFLGSTNILPLSKVRVHVNEGSIRFEGQTLRMAATLGPSSDTFG